MAIPAIAPWRRLSIVSPPSFAPSVSRGPNAVERLWLEGQQPARLDLATSQAVKPDRRPSMGLAVEHGRSLGEAGDHLAFPDHQFTWVKAQRAPGQVAAAREVIHDLIDAGVVPGDGAPTWHVPADPVAEKTAKLALAAARVEAALRAVQALEDLGGVAAIHATSPDSMPVGGTASD